MSPNNLFKEKSFLEHKSILQGISVLQILTAIGGFAALYEIIQNETTTYLLILIFAPIFVLDILGGVLLFRKKLLGFQISFIMQLIHSIKFSVLGLKFGATIPIYFYVTLKFFGLGFDAGFETTNISFLMGSDEVFISVNIITALFAIMLLKIRKNLR